MTNSIRNIELPKDDDRCAAILRMVIGNLKEKERERENESRSDSSSSSSSNQGYPNKIYALRQKMLGSYNTNETDSRTASSSAAHTISSQGPNKIYELRKTMVGLGLLSR